MKPLVVVDLYCGAGGATTGMLHALKARGHAVRDALAINHWPIAVETHTANHPMVRHLCEEISSVDPCAAVPGGRVDILWASPECTHHSRARGGKPRQNQSRAGANHVLAWLDKLYVPNLILENVPEFLDWGPLNTAGEPIKSKKGECFKAFVESLRARNYNVDWRIVCAADYGDATTRRRVILIARRKPHKITWPEPTHRPVDRAYGESASDLLAKVQPWKPAREIIDWSDLGQPLSQRKRPLSPNTMRRIEAGLRKFCGLPFVLPTRGDKNQVRDPERPLQTITCDSRGIALVQPFLMGQQSCAAARSVEDPAPTVATDGAIALVQPFLVKTDNVGKNGGNTHTGGARSIEAPLSTTVSKQNVGLVNAFLVSTRHGGTDDVSMRSKSTDGPLPTLTAKGEWGLCQPFLIHANGTSESHLTSSAKSVNAPTGTVLANGNHQWLVRPFLTKYYGTANGSQSVDDPLDAVTTKDRFLLVNPQTNEAHELEIYFRLLKVEELARAHSFPDDYVFSGTKTDAVKQIGNSNPVGLTAAMTSAVL